MTNAPLNSQPAPRHLEVHWRDQFWTMTAIRSGALPLPASSGWNLARCPQSGLGIQRAKRPPGVPFSYSTFKIQYLRRAFTILEMLVVITIIGIMAAIALPHLPGMTRANSMTAALQQMVSDCALARQLAITHRSTVYMVFVPPYSSWAGSPANEQSGYNSLLAHQYGAYALVSLRTVGDQPGQANPQYLTEWKALPDGVFVAKWKFPGQGPVPPSVSATNTLTGASSVFSIVPFPNNLNFPFPAVDALPFTMPLPYIGFTPLGQLTTNNDEYIPLARGSVFYVAGSGAVTASANEAPANNSINNCNLIHIDWLTARAKIERNQLR